MPIQSNLLAVTCIQQSPVFNGLISLFLCVFEEKTNKVKPVLRGHIWDNDKVAL
jgi:hypothetical protein